MERTPEFTFSDRLRKARKLAGVSSQDMASLLGASRTTISNWENGRGEPTASTVAKWADLTDVDLVWLIVGEDDGAIRSRCGSQYLLAVGELAAA